MCIHVDVYEDTYTLPTFSTEKISHLNLLVQMCGMFVLEDSKSVVELLVNQGKDRAAMEEQLKW